MAENEKAPIGEEPPNPYKSDVSLVNNKNATKTYSSSIKCTGCNDFFKLLDLLPSGAGSAWRKCPKCGLNFQFS